MRLLLNRRYEFANILNSSFSSCSELTIPLGGVLTVVAGIVISLKVGMSEALVEQKIRVCEHPKKLLFQLLRVNDPRGGALTVVAGIVMWLSKDE